jgi:hypothetical protein
MGSFNYTCGVTQQSIKPDDPCYVIILYNDRFSTVDDWNTGTSSPTDIWQPIEIPFECTYEDYGRFKILPNDFLNFWIDSQFSKNFKNFQSLLDTICENYMIPFENHVTRFGIMAIKKNIYDNCKKLVKKCCDDIYFEDNFKLLKKQYNPETFMEIFYKNHYMGNTKNYFKNNLNFYNHIEKFAYFQLLLNDCRKIYMPQSGMGMQDDNTKLLKSLYKSL